MAAPATPKTLSKLIVTSARITVKIAFLRLKKRRHKNRYDKFSKKFYVKAQNSFLKIAKNKNNYFVFDSSHNNNELEKKIFKVVLTKLLK